MYVHTYVHIVYYILTATRNSLYGKYNFFLIGVSFDVERGISGFARNATSDVFALTGCSVCLNKRTLHSMQKYNAALRSSECSLRFNMTITELKKYFSKRKASEYTQKIR